MYHRKNKICIIGGDDRQAYLARSLRHDGYDVSCFAVPELFERSEETLADALAGAGYVVLPFPVSPDCFRLNAPAGEPIRLCDLFSEIADGGHPEVFGGAVSACVAAKALEHGIKITDYGKNEAVAIKNAALTAEGALGIAIKETPRALRDSRVTVFGYGRIGKQLCRLLGDVGAKVSGIARKPEDIALMETEGTEAYDYDGVTEGVSRSGVIFNTVPACVIDERVLSSLEKETLVIDLASAPGGVDREAAERLGIRVICALSLPGKTAPESSAGIIKEALLKDISGK